MVFNKIDKLLLPHKYGFNRLNEWYRYTNIRERLKIAYRKKLLPLEEHHYFHEFHTSRLHDCDFDVNPMVMVVGQYSTGKTTLIKYLLKSDYPGIRVGPEPTTDKFIAVMYNERNQIIPGNALITDSKKPFGPLSRYGNNFLTRFQCSALNNPLLQDFTLIDTPGILSGEKQRVDRGYDFAGVLEWFADRVDRIILLFDAHKLDISDEFKWAIEALKRNNDKILIVLNKADMVDHQSLMRIYGSLMWSLRQVINTPEVPRVHIGSFWDKATQNAINKKLFEDEERDLFKDLEQLPTNAVLRKLNDLSKRARLVRVHAYIMDAIKKSSSSLFKRSSRKQEIIENLEDLFQQMQNDLPISAGDFPDVKQMQQKLARHDFSCFKAIEPSLIEAVDEMLTVDIPKIISLMAEEPQSDFGLKIAPYKTEAEPLDENPKFI